MPPAGAARSPGTGLQPPRSGYVLGEVSWDRLLPPRRRLVVASFLMLFVELAVIRWGIATVVYLNAFTNLLLLASFLGIGLAFLRPAGSEPSFRHAPLALAAFAVLVVLFPVEAAAAGGGRELRGAFGRPPLPPWVHLALLFAATAGVLTTVTDEVARTFGRFRPLQAYRLDVIGSLAGILAFAALSFAGADPFVWTSVVAIVIAVLLGDRLGRPSIACLVAAVGLALLQGVFTDDRWSPYNRIGTEAGADGTVITANGLPHQSVTSVERLRATSPASFMPYRRALSLERVLILGSGAGNDVAVAIASGAEHVDAVEIDGELVDLGRQLHPDDPYEDPRVTVHVDDGRAFLERTGATYDLVVFALPQSIALVGGRSSVRLESFLLTREAFAAARERLASDGVLSLIKGRRRRVYDAFAATIDDAFDRRPCLEVAGSGARERAVVTIGNRPGSIACPGDVAGGAHAEAIPIDDRPFPHLRGRAIPPIYLGSMVAVVVASAIAVRAIAGPFRAFRPYLDLSVMGAAFLLLETSNVVRFALLFGTTWFVNALVFFGILASVLAAVETAERIRPRRTLLHTALGLAIAAAWLVPPETLLDLPVVPRFIVAVIVAFAPVGVLEYASLAIGYRALLVLVAGLYALAFVTTDPAPTEVRTGDRFRSRRRLGDAR